MSGFHSAWASSWHSNVAVKTPLPSSEPTASNPSSEQPLPTQVHPSAGKTQQETIGNTTAVDNKNTSLVPDWDPSPKTTTTTRQRRKK